jgi:hypothetical protein
MDRVNLPPSAQVNPKLVVDPLPAVGMDLVLLVVLAHVQAPHSMFRLFFLMLVPFNNPTNARMDFAPTLRQYAPFFLLINSVRVQNLSHALTAPALILLINVPFFNHA